MGDFGEDYLYFGEGQDGKKHGKGVCVTPNLVFEGEWQYDKKVKGY